MVRLKHRYLLVNILYPDPKTTNARIATEAADHDAPFSLQFHQPSSQQLNIKILLRIIRDGVAELFGDYGSGKVAGTLQGMSHAFLAICYYFARQCLSNSP